MFGLLRESAYKGYKTALEEDLEEASARGRDVQGRVVINDTVDSFQEARLHDAMRRRRERQGLDQGAVANNGAGEYRGFGRTQARLQEASPRHAVCLGHNCESLAAPKAERGGRCPDSHQTGRDLGGQALQGWMAKSHIGIRRLSGNGQWVHGNAGRVESKPTTLERHRLRTEMSEAQEQRSCTLRKGDLRRGSVKDQPTGDAACHVASAASLAAVRPVVQKEETTQPGYLSAI